MVIERKNLKELNALIENVQEGNTFLIHKEETWTSFDAVKKLRFLLQRKAGLKKLKVGHAGTLDPLATGLLIISAGRDTKKISEYQNLEKEYSGCIKLGARTDSYDRETEEKDFQDVTTLSDADIEWAKEQLTGPLLQTPPMFSAIKSGGKKLYQMAREGKTIERKKREVEIMEFQIKGINLPFLEFNIKCSKGTYIRSVARDIGELLDVGGYLYSLNREAIGAFLDSEALTLQEIEAELFAKRNTT